MYRKERWDIIGACYSVYLAIRFLDGQKEAATRCLQQYISKDKRIDYSLEHYASEGILPNSFDGLMHIFLAGWKHTHFVSEFYPDGLEVYKNDFDASYSWKRVMQEMFSFLEPYLQDESFMEICTGNDWLKLVIQSHKVIYNFSV